MLKIEHISYAYGELEVLRDVSLSIEEGEILCLLGPSGCGKTTLLRIIAGLETGYQGNITLLGDDLVNVPVYQRGFGLMFQDFALFPHMSIGENVAYGLKRQGVSKRDISKRTNEILNRVGLGSFGNRDVNMLSGGQKQRVALARSLAPNPKLLMLDEPLGSLDALLREQLIIELRDIIKSVGLTSIYVTHDQTEAYAIADRIIVMNQGQIEQIDTAQKLYFSPQTEFVARFLGLSNIFSLPTNPIFDSFINSSGKDFGLAKAILIHPAGIHVLDDLPSEDILMSGVIEKAVFRGGSFQLHIRLNHDVLLITSTVQNKFVMGDHVAIQIDPDFILPLR